MGDHSRLNFDRIDASDTSSFRKLRLRALQEDPQAFASTHEREVQRSFADWQAWVEQSSAGEAAFIALARNDGAAVGMAGGYLHDERPADREVWGMWISPAWRGRGVGDGLVHAVEDWAAAAGAGRLTLWVVESNTTAIGFYRRVGFVETGEKQPLPSDDSLVEIQMSKEVVR